jgi:hypothetical protein
MPFNPMMTAPAIPPHPLLPAPWPGTSSPVAMADPTTATIRITTTATGKRVIELLDDSDDDDDGDNDDADHDHCHSTNQDDDDTSSVIEVSSPTKERHHDEYKARVRSLYGSKGMNRICRKCTRT